MNIFIMILVFLFMAGYYLMDAPSQRIAHTETDMAVQLADLRSIAECTSAAHLAALQDFPFEDICVQQYGVESDFVCLNDKQAVINCEVSKNKKPEYSFVITATAPIDNADFNKMMEIIDAYYADAGAFGIFADGAILTAGRGGRRAVPSALAKFAKLENGQLIYMTQYEIPDIQTEFAVAQAPDIVCESGMMRVWRFGQWQCAKQNIKTICAGDTIWDEDMGECIANESRRPLCASKQTAVLVYDVWECIDPFADIECPAGQISRLDYNTFEWECVADADSIQDAKPCADAGRNLIRGRAGIVNVAQNVCTDCEETITDPDTCAIQCVPSAAKLNDPKCYPDARSCSGSNRGFYFGFADSRAAASAGYEIPAGFEYSRNRKFNCMDCGDGRIDNDKSVPPFVAVCE